VFQEISIHNIITNASYEGICVGFERKIITTVVFLPSNCPQVQELKII